MRRRPGRIDREDAARERKRDQRRAGKRGDAVEGAEPPGIARDGGARRRERLRGLRDENDPSCASTKRAPSASRAQASTGSQAALCRATRPSGAIGAIAHEIGGEIFRSASAAPRTGASTTPSMIVLASRVSGILAGSMTSLCASHSAASACASAGVGAASARRAGVLHRTAVESNAKGAVGGFDLDPLVEPLAATAAAWRGAPPRSDRAADSWKCRRTDRACQSTWAATMKHSTWPFATSLATLRADLVGACAFNDDEPTASQTETSARANEIRRIRPPRSERSSPARFLRGAVEDRRGLRSRGFHAYHTAEHHATPLGLAASPSVFLAAVAQRTQRLRFGPLVYTLPLHHPLRLVGGDLHARPDQQRTASSSASGAASRRSRPRYYGVDPRSPAEDLSRSAGRSCGRR